MNVTSLYRTSLSRRNWLLGAGLAVITAATTAPHPLVAQTLDANRDTQIGVIYRDDDEYSADDYFIVQGQNDWDYGWYYDERTKTWEFGWHIGTRDFYDDTLDRSDYSSFHWKRDFGWYYDPVARQWSYGFHLNEDIETDRDRPARQSFLASNNRMEGEIERVFADEVDGREFLFVTLDTNAGRRVTVNLGPLHQYDTIQMREGDRIAVAGDFTRRGSEGYQATHVYLPHVTVAVRDEQASRRVNLARSETGPMEIERLAGDVLNVFATDMKGDTHLFVDVRDASGQTFRADLGSADLYGSASLKAGQPITILGRKETWRGAPMIKAEHVRVDNLSLSVPRERPATTFDSRITGTIRNMYKQKVSNEEHLIAQVESDAGRLIVVDLGPTWKVDDLREGDEISAVGRWHSAPDGSMLVADRLSTPGLQGQGHVVAAASDPSRGEQLSGTIQSLELINMLGQRHTFATIETAEGRSLRVDLGPKTAVDALNLAPSDRVTFTSRGSSHARGQALVADRLDKLDGRPSDHKGFSPSLGLHLDGRITAVRREMVPGFHREQLVATIELDDGTARRVVLGQHERLRDAFIEPGDRVSIVTREVAADPKLLMADELRLNGRLLFVGQGSRPGR